MVWASSWLPHELGGLVQPYSMGPLMQRMRIPMKYAVQSMGTARKLDVPELNIRAVFMAPSAIQYQARAETGVERVIYFTPKGLVEALRASGLKK